MLTVCIIILVILALYNLKTILGLVMQIITTYIAFQLHPILGFILAYAFVVDWSSKIFGKKQEKYYHQTNKQQYQKKEYSNNNQQRQQNNYKHQERPKQQTYYKTTSYFSGCTTKEQIKKRHRELCMKYHPDRGGNVEIFRQMQSEYEKLKVRF